MPSLLKSSLLAGAIFALVSASPVHVSARSSSRPCTEFTIPVPVTATNFKLDLVKVDSNIDAVHYEQDLDTWDNPTLAERVLGNITISDTYNIHAQLCIPPNGTKKTQIQIATHGGGFDSRYWAVQRQGHNYVEAALKAGYSILTYDRLSTGQSDHPNAYTVVQAPLQVEILRSISELVRNNQIWQYVSTTSMEAPDMAFDKIIHVAHSFGSILTYGLTLLYPELSDAAVLTGFLINKEVFASRYTAMGYEYALQNDPKLFANSSSGYVLPGTPWAYQTGFFSSRRNHTLGIGGFEPALLDYAYSIRQPQAAAEMISSLIAFGKLAPASNYAGPVRFMAGEFDFIVCLGDCRNSYNATMVAGMYPAAKDVDIYLQAGTGHGLPFHRGAQTGFQSIFDWLAEQGF